MQLMTFNSLLMFDIVFVFFLFLVGVTCLVYYLPTGKQQPSPAVHCKHTRQHYYHPNHSHHHHHHNNLNQHHHHHHQQQQQQHQEQLQHQHKQQQQQQDLQNHRYHNRHYHQLQQQQQQDQIEDEDSQHQQPQQQCCRNSYEHQQIVYNKATQKITCHHPCQCDDVSDCSGHYCSRSYLSLDSIENSPDRRVQVQKHHLRHQSSQSYHQLHHTHYQQQENQQKLKLHKQSDHCFVDDSDDNDDVIYDSGGGRYNALGATFTEHFVVVNETERILPPPPHCCYVKAKLADIKECAGPIDDV